LIGKQLTEENHRQLLDDVRGKTKRQVLEVLARRWPKVAASSQIRKLPVPRRAVAAGPSGTLEPLADDSYCLQLHVSGAINAKLELARDLMSHANASGDLAVVVERALDVLIEKLQKRRFGQTIGSRRARATETDRNQHLGQPKSGSASGETSASRGESANREEVSTPRASAGLVGVTMEEASASGRAVATAESVARRRESTRQADAATCQPSNMQASATSAVLARRGGDTAPKRRRHISHEVRRQVLERDGLRCSYVSPHGQRCCERAFLQLDHQRPWAKGGNDSFENLRVLCGAHNRMLAERELGAAVVRRAIRKEGPNR
jgi:hypothetical protein